ncbi:probable disease resistance protein At5g66900 [Ziziphus jujuba]|uniref:Probable disease resistance protein At5g66900 n=1 Tax=Ziziphus jujuba TaxID=326968 RepID=A0A6P4A724_ZIZJJ|nr:probable disease resistance protein At5g66900 [Ziziphus jujuba]
MMIVDKVVEEAISMIFEELKDLREKNSMFKPCLKKVRGTVQYLRPLIKEIQGLNKELDLSESETLDFASAIKSGAQLVRECLKVRWYCICVKAGYTEELLELDDSLQRFIQILLVQSARDVKRTLIILQSQQAGVNGDGSNQSVSLLSCHVPALPSLIVGLDEPLRELKTRLVESDRRVLVVTAAGGCGKTLLAQMFCHDNEVKARFNGNIFFVPVSKTPPSLSLVVQKLYEHKGKDLPSSVNEANAVDIFRQLLNQLGPDPTLLVLDDVWEGSESLIQNLDLQIKDYKILVTSRFELPSIGPHYRLNPLNGKDAMTLFRQWAFLEGDNNHIADDIVEKIVDYYKVIPLALKIVAGSLRRRPEEVWQRRLKECGSSRLSSKSSDNELLSCLQSNLHELKVIFKEYFMDLGLFPEDQRIPAAALIDMWTELYELEEDSDAIAMLYDLTNRNLANLLVTRKDVNEVDGYYSEHFVTQHDLLRELAIYESSHEPPVHGKRYEEPVEQRKRLILDLKRDEHPNWCKEHKKQSVSLACFQGKGNMKEPFYAHLVSISTDEDFSSNWFDMQLPKAKVLVLNFRTKDYTLPEFVKNMKKLMVLIITNYSFFPAELRNFKLLGSLNNLKRIRLERISIPSLSMTRVPLKNLHKLSLFMCSIGKAFSNCSIPISNLLPKLREMNVDFCDDLVELPASLCNIIHLEKLNITHCTKLTSLPEEIGKLENLKELRLRSCISLLALPDSIKNLRELKFLDISDCISIQNLPEDFGGLCSLRKFNMRNCSRLEELPSSVSGLGQLKDLICDEEKIQLWEQYLPSLTNTVTRSARDDPNLNWLPLFS